MSNTPNARKAAARQHQREHGGSYAAALAAVSPEAAAAAKQPGAAPATGGPIRAVRYFDEATADVVGQGAALGKLRTLLGQHVVAGRGAAEGSVVVEIGAPARGLWEETICIAFAQAWMLGTAGVAPEARAAEPKNGITWVGDAAIHDTAASLGREQRKELEKCRLVVRYTHGSLNRFHAIQLRYLSAPELGFVAVRSLGKRAGEALGFTGQDVAERVSPHLTGTGDEAGDLAEKAVARALIRSMVDEPGSSAGVTIEDVVEVFAFLKKDAGMN